MIPRPILLLAMLFLGTSVATKQFVLRLDDIQDFFQRDAQMALIDWCMTNGVAVSLGVIGPYFGTDKAVVEKVKECLALGPSLCEVTNHGPDASTRLGDLDNLIEVQMKVEESHNSIRATLDGYTPRTFAPHSNSWSDTLTTALKNLKYQVITASNNERMRFDSTQKPMHMPQKAITATYSYVDESWTVVHPHHILAACQMTYAAGDEACVVSTHPQEYHLEMMTLDDLASIIEALRAEGWKSKTFLTVSVKSKADRMKEKKEAKRLKREAKRAKKAAKLAKKEAKRLEKQKLREQKTQLAEEP